MWVIEIVLHSPWTLPYCLYNLQDYLNVFDMMDCIKIKYARISIWVMIRHKVDLSFKVIMQFERHTSTVWPIIWRSWHFTDFLGCILFCWLLGYNCCGAFCFEDWLGLLVLGLKVYPLCNCSRDCGGWFIKYWCLRKI